MDVGEYCRAIEAHLRNVSGGELVRVKGTAWELVCAWHAEGVPLKVVFRGIDRYVERRAAKNARPRPVQVDFCKHDVVETFDEWRRAIGVPTVGEGDTDGARRKESLAAHLERVVARLTALRASTSGGSAAALDAALDETVREIDAARGSAKGLRGEARQALLDRLRALEQRLTSAARGVLAAGDLEALGREAEAELAPFKERMPAAAYQQAREACVDRLVRERLRLPVISLDA